MEKQVSVCTVTAFAMWAITALLIGVGGILGVLTEGVPEEVAVDLMVTGLACSAGAATVTIKHLIWQQNDLLRDAFDHGHETAVRKIH